MRERFVWNDIKITETIEKNNRKKNMHKIKGRKKNMIYTKNNFFYKNLIILTYFIDIFNTRFKIY